MSFPTNYPSNPVNNNAGVGFYWNQDGDGETDLLCYGNTKIGGLTISTVNDNRPPMTICRFLRNYIGFAFAPSFATDETVGNIGATTQYVDDRLKTERETAPQYNSAQRPTWFMTTNAEFEGNSATPAGKNLGSTHNNNAPMWDHVITYGDANRANWEHTEAIFTANKSGTYHFQLCLFTTQPTKIGRFLQAGGTCITGGSQYLSFNQSYLDTSGAFTISLMYYMNIGDTFYLRCQDESPNFYYANGHTTLQIIKIL